MMLKTKTTKTIFRKITVNYWLTLLLGLRKGLIRQLKRKFADLEGKDTPFIRNFIFRDTRVITPGAGSITGAINNSKLPGEAALNT